MCLQTGILRIKFQSNFTLILEDLRMIVFSVLSKKEKNPLVLLITRKYCNHTLQLTLGSH